MVYGMQKKRRKKQIQQNEKKIKWLIFKNKNYEQRKNVRCVRYAEHRRVTQNKF